MPSRDCLEWTAMSAVLNRVDAPNRFLVDLLYPASTVETLDTESVELGTVIAGREMAPFVKKNGRSIMVPGEQTKFANVETPNIRISRPMEASNVMYTRRPGNRIFSSGSENGAFEGAVARDISNMERRIQNTEEWMVAQTLTGFISYKTYEEDAWELTIPNQQATITTSPLWSLNDGTENAEEDVLAVKRSMMNYEGMAPSIAIGGESAADAFSGNTEIRAACAQVNVQVGFITREEQYNDVGVIFLGRFSGIDHVEYARTVNLPEEMGGTQNVKLINDLQFHYCALGDQTDRTFYYGAINDIKALKDNTYIARRFGKSWEEEDPSVLMQLAASRPLPFPRRPDTSIRMVVAS